MNYSRIFFIPLAAIILILASGERGSAAYQLLGPANGVSYSWDGTYANRQISENQDYKFDYGPEAKVDFTLPWPFPFNGASYNQITAHANGSIRIGSQTGPLAHAWNADLSSYYYGGVFVQRKTNPERLVVEWATETFDSAGYARLNSFEVVLDPSGGIRVDYRGFDPASNQDAGSGLTSPADGIDLSITNTYGPVTGLAETSFLFLPQETYTITSTAGANGSITPDGDVQVAIGSSQTFTIAPAIGYWVADVMVDGASIGSATSYTFSDITSSHTISATFGPTITTSAGPGGVVSPGTAYLVGGTDVTFTITADAGYQIDDVLVDGISAGPVTAYTFSNVTMPHTISATFTNQDTSPPVMSNLAATPSEISAAITWETDEPSTSNVKYGLTTAYEMGTIDNGALVTSHSVTLSGLAPGTTYPYMASSMDSSGNTVSSVDQTFTTAAQGAVYYVDTFSENALGQGLPAGWTGRWNTAGNEDHWSIVADGSDGKTLKYTHGDESSRPKGLSLDAAGSTGNAEILAKVKILTTGSGYQALLNLCGRGAAGSHTMFFVTLQGGKFFIARNVNGGGYAVIGPQIPYPIAFGESHLIRFRVEPGGYLYAKIWPSGTTEPTQWSCWGQDAVNYADGWVGIEGYNTDALFDWVSVAINGGTARFPEGSPVAHYVDTFSGNALGQGVPAGWTGQWNTAGNEDHWSIVDEGSDGKTLKYTHGDESSRPKGLSLDAAGSTGNAEILAKVKILTTGSGYQGLLNLCARGAAGSHTMFFVTLQGGKFYMARNVGGGGYAVIGSQLTYPVAVGESHLIRFRVEPGGYLYAKVWPEGTAEPAQWSCLGQDAANYAEGWVGIEGYNTDTLFDWVSVATNGGTAQFAP